ncbi:flavoprotein [Pseudalkalibacillus hwajinpoensis]|uniref:Flavoprotein n=1 Tax=Guptibacillus hwajinpoensis TaxID=208199 RepID=A0A4U1MN68_9BACL|nr:flavoprotein [Pseudalkalibacillus hwajinpoensis]TKD72437.1 flavoprotein [Pseudalkalibacillus hwajinpoensis]
MSGFQEFLDEFLSSWRRSSIDELKSYISESYQAREVTSQSEVYDFHYEESIQGWEQAFHAFEKDGTVWVLEQVAVTPLRRNEMLAIIHASIKVDGEQSETGNVFFDTFRKGVQGNWKLVRSYIEAGVPIRNMSLLHNKAGND